MIQPTYEIFVDTIAPPNDHHPDGYDYIPHTFIKITGPDGSVSVYGFAPEQHGEMFGAGKVYDDADHEYQISSGPLAMTVNQYDKFVEYVS